MYDSLIDLNTVTATFTLTHWGHIRTDECFYCCISETTVAASGKKNYFPHPMASCKNSTNTTSTGAKALQDSMKKSF